MVTTLGRSYRTFHTVLDASDGFCAALAGPEFHNPWVFNSSPAPDVSSHRLKTRRSFVASPTRCCGLIVMSVARLHGPFFGLGHFFDDAPRPRTRSPLYEDPQVARMLMPR